MGNRPGKKSVLAEILFTIRLLITVFSLAFLIAGLTVVLSTPGTILIVSQFLVVLGIVTPFKERWRVFRLAAVLGMLCILGVLCLGIWQEVIPPRQGEIMLVGNDRAISLGEVIDERDLVLTATRVLPYMGGLSFTEASGLLPSISHLYSSMESQRGHFTSPLAESLMGVPYLFDSKVISLQAREVSTPKRAIIFLHGVGGNWSLLCWIISQGGQAIGADTYCPSLGILGTWGSSRGRTIVKELLEELQKRGKHEIYLVGMSAGAVGAGQLAPDFEQHLRGVALICGAHPAIRRSKLPVLFLYGKNDERFPSKLLAWIANASAKNSTRATIEEVDGGHFYPIKQSDAFLERFSNWLKKVAMDGGEIQEHNQKEHI